MTYQATSGNILYDLDQIQNPITPDFFGNIYNEVLKRLEYT